VTVPHTYANIHQEPWKVNEKFRVKSRTLFNLIITCVDREKSLQPQVAYYALRRLALYVCHKLLAKTFGHFIWDIQFSDTIYLILDKCRTKIWDTLLKHSKVNLPLQKANKTKTTSVKMILLLHSQSFTGTPTRK